MRILKIIKNIANKRNNPDREREMPFVEHLEELRKRALVSIAFVLVFSVLSFIFIDRILSFITGPVGGLVFIKPTEAFMARIKLAFFSGVFFSVPVMILQVWRFVSPALYKREKRYVYWVLPFSYLLFLFGVAFAFFGVLPVGLKYLLGYGTADIRAMITVTSYISFISAFLMSFGVIFQMPIAIIFLSRLGIVTPRFLRKNRKYAILIIFIAAGVLTPSTDIFSQLMMAAPLLLLYEASILLSGIFSSQRKKRQAVCEV